MHFRIRRGLDVPLDGPPETLIDVGSHVDSVALLGADYVGLEPRMTVDVGDKVRVGQPLFHHKRDPRVVFTAPGSGVVTAINRGARRALKSVVVELEEESVESTLDGGAPDASATGLRDAMLRAGLWTAFRTRPFSRIPHSKSEPGAIFITALDTRPLAGDPRLVIAEYPEAFAHGLRALARLSPAPVYLCTGPDWQAPTGEEHGVQHAVFEGPHPAGLPGTHIHHLHPVGIDRTVWHIGYQDVIAVGRLVQDGRLWLERIVALGGNGFERPRMLRTRLGASLAQLTAGEIRQPDQLHDLPRVISGSVLSGRLGAGFEAYLGRYHVQVSAVQQPQPVRRQRWRRLFDRRFSFAGTFARASGHNAAPFDTDQNGRATALVPIDAFERLIPMDVLTQPLLRALLIKDTDRAQALGALELDEEDLELCSFICPGKNDYGAVLRANLEQIEREG